MNKYRIVTCVALLLGFVANAQNPRLALYGSSPMLVNPAYTGYYSGKIRVGAHASLMEVDTASMLHTNLSVELRSNYDEADPLPRSYTAVGLNFYRYGHPSSALSAMFPSLNLAYHTFMDRRRRHGISVGGQAAYALGSYDATKFGDFKKVTTEISGGGFIDKKPGNSLTSSLSYFDFSIGGLYFYKTREFDVEFGLSMYHLFYPSTDVFKEDKEHKQRHRGVASLNVSFELNQTKKLSFKSLYWQDGLYWLSKSTNDQTNENEFASWLGLELVSMPLQEKNLILNYGIFTRNIKTILPVIEADYKRKYILRATYEYPINSESFGAYRIRIAELALVMYFNPRGKVVPFTED
jgi:type IX secretion system PorP/SprF family membrane protein